MSDYKGMMTNIQVEKVNMKEKEGEEKRKEKREEDRRCQEQVRGGTPIHNQMRKNNEDWRTKVNFKAKPGNLSENKSH